MRIWNNIFRPLENLGLAIITAFLSLGFTSLALGDAGSSCHFHGKKEATEQTILRCTTVHRERLAKKGTIDTSWSNLNHESIQKVTGPKGKEEWQVKFNNPSPKDETKKNLYLFFSLTGNFTAANYTGN